jgi:hypothetical protein
VPPRPSKRPPPDSSQGSSGPKRRPKSKNDPKTSGGKKGSSGSSRQHEDDAPGASAGEIKNPATVYKVVRAGTGKPFEVEDLDRLEESGVDMEAWYQRKGVDTSDGWQSIRIQGDIKKDEGGNKEESTIDVFAVHPEQKSIFITSMENDKDITPGKLQFKDIAIGQWKTELPEGGKIDSLEKVIQHDITNDDTRIAVLGAFDDMGVPRTENELTVKANSADPNEKKAFDRLTSAGTMNIESGKRSGGSPNFYGTKSMLDKYSGPLNGLTIKEIHLLRVYKTDGEIANLPNQGKDLEDYKKVEFMAGVSVLGR